MVRAPLRMQPSWDEDVLLGPQQGDVAFDFFESKMKYWPAGTYSLSVTCSGSETATAVSTFTVAYKK
jgi:hypothetical protein